jgi:hypothetical protein
MHRHKGAVGDNPMVFLRCSISTTLLGLAVLAMCAVLIPSFSKTREEAFGESTR